MGEGDLSVSLIQGFAYMAIRGKPRECPMSPRQNGGGGHGDGALCVNLRRQARLRGLGQAVTFLHFIVHIFGVAMTMARVPQRFWEDGTRTSPAATDAGTPGAALRPSSALLCVSPGQGADAPQVLPVRRGDRPPPGGCRTR